MIDTEIERLLEAWHDRHRREGQRKTTQPREAASAVEEAGDEQRFLAQGAEDAPVGEAGGAVVRVVGAESADG